MVGSEHSHPSILCAAYPTQEDNERVTGEPGAYPSGLGAQGREHSGWDASSSQGAIAHTPRIILECQTAYDTCLWIGGGNP
ncbi:hypothetical protein PGIGA_G00200910 [Pangasianodon gigas]|uniref:Uncharacterized protein n=1 Tax=Pangasianodon gigas TaxID=30993 RepID=A0ACC5WER8_PANGG|nr:hypothetical protein [Pangasianodon gigas]